MDNVLIVLDSFEYKSKEELFFAKLSKICVPFFFYTKYENGITELFQRTKIIGGLLTHISYWILSFKYAFELILISRKECISNIIFVNPIVGIFYLLLSKVFKGNQNVCLGGFLFEPKKNKIYYNLRKQFTNYCLNNAGVVFVYGENEVVLYGSIFPKNATKFKYIQYGRDFDYKNVKDFIHSGAYIASGGRSNRKFETLCASMSILRRKRIDIDCLIATRPECVNQKMLETPVKFIYGITLNQFGSFISHSELFILPLLDTNISAGHMAMMEAMANNKPIIVTDIPSIRNYVSEKYVTFYKADNPSDLASKIEYVLTHLESSEIKDKVRNGRELYDKTYSFGAFLERITSESLQELSKLNRVRYITFLHRSGQR